MNPAIASTTEIFNPINGMEARLFGRDMQAAGANAAKLALHEVRGLLQLDEHSQELLDPANLIKAAMSAGALVGKSGFVDALAAMQSTLDDYDGEAAGFAIHSLMRRKEQGASAAEVQETAQDELVHYAEDGGSDAVQLAVAAFAVGATLEDGAVAERSQALLNDMVIGRTEA